MKPQVQFRSEEGHAEDLCTKMHQNKFEYSERKTGTTTRHLISYHVVQPSQATRDTSQRIPGELQRILATQPPQGYHTEQPHTDSYHDL